MGPIAASAVAPFSAFWTRYLGVREGYGSRLRLLEHRYLTAEGRRAGGIRVRDHMNHQPTLAIVQDVEFVLRDRS